jgi:hypothetical protein
MVASVQDHFHLVESATPGDTTTTGEWKASAQNLKPQATPIPSVKATVIDALDGTRHFHVLKDGADPIVYEDWQILVRCPTWSDYETLRGYLGKTKYFVSPIHDPAAHNSYTTKVFVARVAEIKAQGPMMSVLYVPIFLADASREAS